MILGGFLGMYLMTVGRAWHVTSGCWFCVVDWKDLGGEAVRVVELDILAVGVRAVFGALNLLD